VDVVRCDLATLCALGAAGCPRSDFLRDLTDATATSCQDECLGGFFHGSIKPPGEADNHAQEVHVADDWLRRGSPFLEKLTAHENVPKKGNIACMPLSKRTKTTP
jgi:hypothetical protein